MEVSVVNFVCSTVKQSNRQEQGTNVKTGDNELIKQINYGIILDTIRESGPISRIDISRKTGLSRSTCSIICESMLSQNLLIETGKSMSSGGRKPVLLELNANAGIVISLKLMEGVIVGALVNLGGKVLSKKHIIVPRNLEPDQYIESLKQYIDATLKAVTGPDTVGPDTVGPDTVGPDTVGPDTAGPDTVGPDTAGPDTADRKTTGRLPQKVFGIGIGMSGRIDNTEGILLESSILEWKHISIGKILEEHFHIPVFLENDVNTFAMGEKYFGAGKPYTNYLCVTIGEGIGLGIVLDGKLYRGHHHGAGEFGHIKISTDPDAPVCSCGRKGCLEAFASDKAITRYVEKSDGRVLSIEEVTEAAENGDEECRKAFHKAGFWLGNGISTLINLFDPEAIIIGGERAGAAELFVDAMKQVIAENTVYELAQDIEIHTLQPDIDHWVRGVATLAIKEFISKAIGQVQ
jgi:N-acetylglucosamine repressor